MTTFFRYLTGGILIFILVCSSLSFAQFQYNPTPNDTLTSVKLLPQKKISFRIYAPNAKTVTLSGSDIPNRGQGGQSMTRRENGVWETTLESIEPGSYRYNFTVDGTFVLDPRNPKISESNMNAWSLFHVPGAAFMDVQDVAHGAVAEVIYYSKSLKRFRRMHVYTPPGYESGNGTYPIFYLLHGAFDCDDSWSTIGRAGIILDNLIAAKKAKPMVVVMPAGHTGPFRFGGPRSSFMDEFVQDFLNDIMPYAELHYRVHTDRNNRAIAGLSMGGAHTLNIAVPHLEKFGYIGVFSSGIFGITGGPMAPQGPSWEETHQQALMNDKLKHDLKLIWFATGEDDFLIETSRATVALFKKYNFNVVYKETTGGHTWINWREYLNEFAPLLFR